ncbi:MAG: YggS family pyridoxal phosphate-dependent enzyme [Bacteroidia bacterium]|nr:YggS family pyridoxal phosphate-dependent enzyme [Bacteroidia bacterium]MDW8157792.1 YggS family pyridoxal phosphate-dependent enzyme [Bacteroidia bacterium]
MKSEQIKANITALENQIRAIAQSVNRDPNEILIIAVSKTHPIEAVQYAYQAGITIFGENRVQELVAKASQLPQAQWHLIGHLQTNKVKQVLPYVKLVHSLDSLRLAETISKHSLALNKITECLVQVNISYEEQKSGIAPEKAEDLLKSIENLPNLKVIGLMGIATHTEDSEKIRQEFRLLKQLFEKFQRVYTNSSAIQMQHLSMGMSHDFAIAIQEGATMLRIGSAIFGPRS